MLSAPLFFELDALINDDSEKKMNIRHDRKKERQTRNKKERQKRTGSPVISLQRPHRLPALSIGPTGYAFSLSHTTEMVRCMGVAGT